MLANIYSSYEYCIIGRVNVTNRCITMVASLKSGMARPLDLIMCKQADQGSGLSRLCKIKEYYKTNQIAVLLISA